MKSITASNTLSPLSEYMEELSYAIEQDLDLLVAAEDETPYKELFTAARYSLLGGGKRLRPILAIATAEALGTPIQASVRPACAIELVHTYSLIHDDLPCMDNDDFRRGKPSLHKAFSEAEAVLAGDFLLTYAFEIIAAAPFQDASQKVELVRLLGIGSGGHGMIGGQIMDIKGSNSSMTLDVLQQMHRCKTGALITTSILFGATIGNASKEDTAILKQFGDNIGLAFQIVDDILDVTTCMKKDGVASSDIRNQKSTYVSLLGIDRAEQMATELYAEALESLHSLPFCTLRLQQLADLVINRKH